MDKKDVIRRYKHQRNQFRQCLHLCTKTEIEIFIVDGSRMRQRQPQGTIGNSCHDPPTEPASYFRSSQVKGPCQKRGDDKPRDAILLEKNGYERKQ